MKASRRGNPASSPCFEQELSSQREEEEEEQTDQFLPLLSFWVQVVPEIYWAEKY